MRILGFDYPDELYYFLEHDMWARALGKSRFQVGISTFGVHVSGNFFYMCRPKPIGTILSQGQTMGVVELSKTVVTIKAPLGGTIVERNAELDDQPELINEDPYGRGWIAVIKASNWEQDMAQLAQGSQLPELAQARMRLEPMDWLLP